ncbi:MAG: hypothetical protein H0T53_14580 [Herpetosiphonaceae bacterium]|nr:hypothetical protein [Herpetosiphonaceae bacterium]
MRLYCTECAAPLKANATHCLECGITIPLDRPAPPTVNAASLPPLPLYNAPQSLATSAAGGAGATALDYEPSLLSQWMEHWRNHSSTAQRSASQALDLSGILVRAVYFLLIGIWASQLWIIFAWLISLTVVGLPVGSAMVRVLPQVAFLSSYRIQTTRRPQSTQTPQTAFGLRALYFVLIGWWVSLLWLELAWVAGITLVGLPLSLAMFSFTPTVGTLARP